MPPKRRVAPSREARARSGYGSTSDTPVTGPKRRTARWSTNGKVDKQSTLTQIDFVKRGGNPKFEDIDLDYEDTTLVKQDSPEPRPKRRKIGGKDTVRRFSPGKQLRYPEEDKENDVFALSMDEPHLPSVFATPKKPQRLEIPSSESPVSPLSGRSTRRFRTDVRSPLKDLSTTINFAPSLVVRDTFETEGRLSVSPSKSIRTQNLRDTGSRQPPKLNSSNGYLNSSRLEVLDSDAEDSDLDLIRSSPPKEIPINFDDTTFVENDPPTDPERPADSSPDLTPSKAEIMKAPISDDSKSDVEHRNVRNQIDTTADVKVEPDTLKDVLLQRPRRTYSARRGSMKREEISSSSDLEELPELGQTSSTMESSNKGPLELPSSPPTDERRLTVSTQPLNNIRSDPRLSLLNSSQPWHGHSDSQQAVAQLEQESQWIPPLVPPSQASTASLSSSPPRGPLQKTQSGSSSRGWFFNPLTDSQLLPHSVMNFDFHRFLAGRAAEPDNLEEETL